MDVGSRVASDTIIGYRSEAAGEALAGEAWFQGSSRRRRWVQEFKGFKAPEAGDWFQVSGFRFQVSSLTALTFVTTQPTKQS